MNNTYRPLSEIEQGMLFLWLNLHMPKEEVTLMRTELSEVAYTIFGPPMVHGISAQLFETVRTMVRGQRVIEAIKELRSQMGWSLKDAKDFIDNHCR